jgi:glycosyltransferase involved in cell wall biosynthesis
MRILHLLNVHCDVGIGIVNVAVDLACLQAQMGHSVGIVSRGGDFEELLGSNGVQVFLLPIPVRLERAGPVGRLALVKAIVGLRRLVKTWRPDVVHVHMATGAALVRLSFVRRPFLFVSTVHNEFMRSAALMGLADRVIAVSEAVAEKLRRRGIAARKIFTVCNGPLETPRRSGSPVPLELQHPAILTVAGLYARKGIADLITAFELAGEQVPHAHLYIVGDGPEREAFRSQAQRSRVSDRIHFEGFQPDPRRYMLASEIFVLASHREPFGLVIAEARACGCAVVGTDVDGIPEAMDGGRRGILVAPGSPALLAGALVNLLEDRAQLARWRFLGSQGLDWLHAARMTRETLSVYADVRGSMAPAAAGG